MFDNDVVSRPEEGARQPIDELVPVEICFGSSWDHPCDLFYARFLALPRAGDIIEFPERDPGSFRVTAVRHRSATPLGGKARVQLLVGVLVEPSAKR
jgi:hypothetical protein